MPLSDSLAGKPDLGFRTFTTVENFFGIIFLQFVGHPPGGDKISFYCFVPLVPSCQGFFVFEHGHFFFFLVGSSVLLSMVA